METTLDRCDGIILYGLNYQNEGELSIQLIELVLSDSRTDLDFGSGKVIKDLTPLERTTDSRKFMVGFKEIVFYQVVDESYCTWDDYEVRDGKDKLQELSKSRYLDFVNENFPFYSALERKGAHYRLITSNEVIDVISYDKPMITELKN